MTSDSELSDIKQLQNTLINIQRLTVKAFNAENLQNLIFIILNDTYQVVKYDRAILFSKQDGKVSIQGVSGQANFSEQTELAGHLRNAALTLTKSSEQRILKREDFQNPKSFDYVQPQQSPSTVYWVPIITNKDEEIGLWMEKYDDKESAHMFEAYGPFLKELLAPGFAAAWKKMSHSFSLYKILPHLSAKKLSYLGLLLLLLLFVVPVRLRVVAPCEVVAKDSFIVTAPVDGIIEKVYVEPGQEIKKDQILFEYDKKVPSYKSNALQKEVDILQAELNQSYALGTENKGEASKLSLLDHKLNKSKLDLEYATRELSLLIAKAPISGLASIDNPDEWRGKPVKTGERIMAINDPKETRIRIWIPERDNISFAFDIPISVFLNPIPTKTFKARFLYIASEVRAHEDQLPSFEAEAEWIDTEEQPKLGLKGSAVIYGERVSLFYYFLRRPITSVRTFLGI